MTDVVAVKQKLKLESRSPADADAASRPVPTDRSPQASPPKLE
ncbi:MAG TPA: hypothetical protein PK176_04420 [Acidobacteriota bacterium]|nr:hypothetical protein [Acidobacteriota bacterium]HQM62532.1 hypothetical protein [Acidobacteriota bacterium]